MTRLVIFGSISLFLALNASLAQDANGAALYRHYCVPCHGASGDASTEGGKRLRAADLRSERVQSKSDQELFNGIAYGSGHKQYPHAFMRRGLTTVQITNLVSYIRGFRSPQKRTDHEQ